MKKTYEILGITKNATKSEIKYAFREHVKENHPDQGGKKSELKKIIAARDKMLLNKQNKSETKERFSVIKYLKDYL